MTIYRILLVCALLTSPVQAAPAATTETPSATAAPADPAAAETQADEPPVLRLPAERAETSRAKALVLQLEQVDRATEAAWLDSGEDRFLALYRPDASGTAFASLLILHDNRQHPDWPGIVRGLREQLSDHGWNTLAVAMPDYLPLPVLPPRPVPEPVTPDQETATGEAPPAEEPESPAPTPPPPVDTEEPSVEYPTDKIPAVVDERIRAGAAFLKKKDPAPVVLVTIGLSAGLAAKNPQTLRIKDIAGIVLIDPVAPEGADFNADLQALNLQVPVLDIVPQWNARSSAPLRLANARRARHQDWQLRKIQGTGPGFNGYEAWVIKAVRGWGEQHFRR